MVKETDTPLNTHLLIERHQLFIVLCIGEVVVASVYGTGGHEVYENQTYTSVALRAAICAAFKIILFDSTPRALREGVDNNPTFVHALDHQCTPLRSCLWTFVHLPLSLSIVLVGSTMEGIEDIFAERREHEGESEKFDILQLLTLFCVGIAAVLMLEPVLGSLHLHSSQYTQLHRRFTMTTKFGSRGICAVLAFAPLIWTMSDDGSSPSKSDKSATAIYAYELGALFISVILDIFGDQIVPVSMADPTSIVRNTTSDLARLSKYSGSRSSLTNQELAIRNSAQPSSTKPAAAPESSEQATATGTGESEDTEPNPLTSVELANS